MQLQKYLISHLFKCKECTYVIMLSFWPIPSTNIMESINIQYEADKIGLIEIIIFKYSNNFDRQIIIRNIFIIKLAVKNST